MYGHKCTMWLGIGLSLQLCHSTSTGEKNLLDSDIPALAAKSPDGAFARQDLVDAIAGGIFPEWYLYIQTLDPADQDKYDFDPLDVTKARPTLFQNPILCMTWTRTHPMTQSKFRAQC